MELAFYPIGMTNDYLKCFGVEQEKFLDLRALIDGEARKVDYISTNYGKALNAISMGIDEDMIGTINRLRNWKVLSNLLPYMLGMLRSFMRLKPQKYVLEIDGIKMKVGASEIAVGKGCFLAGKIRFAKQSKLENGMANYAITTAKSKLKFGRLLYDVTHERMDKVFSKLLYGNCKKITIRRVDQKAFQASFDGELVTINDTLEVTTVPKTINFVIPSI